MSKKLNEFLKIDFRKGRIDGNFAVHSFVSDGYEFVYVPSLNLSGYGKTQEDARQMLNFCLKDFIKTLTDAGEAKAIDEIKSLGWKKHKFFNKYNPPFVDKDGILREFNLSEETKIETSSIAV